MPAIAPALLLRRRGGAPWMAPADYWPELSAATAAVDPPFGVISVPALAANAFGMLDRAVGTPIRLASKSIRVRAVLDAVLALPGYAGVLAYTLPEALWLATSIPDVVVGYPTADRSALRRLSLDAALAGRVTLMVDAPEQLDLIDSVVPPGRRERLRVCIELDGAWENRFLGHVGVWRSPVHSVADAVALAGVVASRPGFRLVGLMAYEAQVAGMTNEAPGRARLDLRLRAAAVRRMQALSVEELAARRGAAVAGVREVTDLEFVNGGGTGSIETTAADPSVTEVTAGSGLFGPHLFDHYAAFTPAPAAAFALSVVRKPKPGLATLLGGGWVASGPSGADRAPIVAWPENLRMLRREGAGEVQTPLTGPGAAALAVGDRVWLRHTKAGELAEHLDSFVLVDDGRIVGTAPTYRGEGKAFL